MLSYYAALQLINMQLLSCKLCHLRKGIDTVQDVINAVPEEPGDTSLVEQYELKLSDYKSELHVSMIHTQLMC